MSTPFRKRPRHFLVHFASDMESTLPHPDVVPRCCILAGYRLTWICFPCLSHTLLSPFVSLFSSMPKDDDIWVSLRFHGIVPGYFARSEAYILTDVIELSVHDASRLDLLFAFKLHRNSQQPLHAYMSPKSWVLIWRAAVHDSRLSNQFLCKKEEATPPSRKVLINLLDFPLRRLEILFLFTSLYSLSVNYRLYCSSDLFCDCLANNTIRSPFDAIVTAAGFRFSYMLLTAYADVWMPTLYPFSNQSGSSVSAGNSTFWSSAFCCFREIRGRTSVWAGNFIRQWKLRTELCLHYLVVLPKTTIITVKYYDLRH